MSGGALRLARDGGQPAVSCQPTLVAPIDLSELKRRIVDLIDRDVFSFSRSAAIHEFPTEFAAYLGARFGLGFSSGTTALLSAYYAVGVAEDTEVIHPAYSWISSISPILYLGARPVFCPIHPDRLTIDPDAIPALISDRTRAISIVHMHGQVCDWDPIQHVARCHGLSIIEDGSHCHGAAWGDRKCGTLGAIGCFSLQGSPLFGKPVAAGEGGVAVTDDERLYERMLVFSQVHTTPRSGRYLDGRHAELAPLHYGMKFRPSPWQMACASMMLESLDAANARRRTVKRQLDEALAQLPELTPVAPAPRATPAGFYGGLNYTYEPSRAVPLESYLAVLHHEGVQARRAPGSLLHLLPVFRHDRSPLRPDGTARVWPELRLSESIRDRIVNILYPFNLAPGDPYLAQIVDAFHKVSAALAFEPRR